MNLTVARTICYVTAIFFVPLFGSEQGQPDQQFQAPHTLVEPCFSPHVTFKWIGNMPIGISCGLFKHAKKSTWRTVVNNLTKGLIPSKESYIKPWLDDQWQAIFTPLSASHMVLGRQIHNRQIAAGMSTVSLAVISIGLKKLQRKNTTQVTVRYVSRLIKQKIVSFIYKKLVSAAHCCAHKKGYKQGCVWYPASIYQDQTLYPFVKKAWHLVAKAAILMLVNQIIDM